MNGDGRDDVMLGAPGVDVFSGRVYVIFGQSSFTSPFSLSTLDGSNGFI
ncbi:MAG: FG-GAP repeat protein [Candidatus Midichloria mitochondrii]|nr:FG-GAP repeat protein [Candidatus Midichloria mitochondrii]